MNDNPLRTDNLLDADKAPRLERELAERTQELDLVKARFELALRDSNVTVFAQDRELRYTFISNPMFGLSVEQIVGHTDDEVLSAENFSALTGMKREALKSGKPRNGELKIVRASSAHWYDFHIEPLREGGRVVGLACTVVDVTERKSGEEHLRVLLRELTHRSKNLLAVVQAMARQSARHSGSTKGFLENFSARLQALARSHDLLVKEEWHGASLVELVRSQLEPYLDHNEPRVSFEGPPIRMKPEAAQSLGLALHELATNAARYGALSSPTGRLSIAWSRRSPAEGSGVEIRWTESGGPNVSNPRHKGFGSLALEGNLVRSLEAEVDWAFIKDGLTCRISIPATYCFAASVESPDKSVAGT